MNKTKLAITLMLTFAFVFAQVGNVAAAPLAQDAPPITGNIVSIEPQTDGTTVLVTLEGGQTVLISVATAAGLDLLVVDENGDPVLDAVTNLPMADENQIGQPVEIPAADVISDETGEEDVHPISALLAAFFDTDASEIDTLHEDGFGFGVIAQALWISRNLTGTEDTVGDASLAAEILTAKQDKAFDTFFENHPEIIFDGDIPTNWGQFKKALSDKKNNLGIVVSGHADDEDSTHPGNGHGNGNGNGHGNGHGNGNGNGHGNGNNP